MLNLNDLLNTAPRTPAVTGEWASVYLEPMIGSGERLTIAVAAKCSDKYVDVRPAIRQEIIEVMYGHRSQAFNSMVDVVATSLTASRKNKIIPHLDSSCEWGDIR